MRCPKCGSYNGKVVDSRPLFSDTVRRRRYKCLDCDYRWNTIEKEAKEHESES